MDPYPIGCDVSWWQRPEEIDYSALNVKIAGVRFSVSDYYKDGRRFEHTDGFQEAGVPVLAYHVNRPGNDTEASLDNFFEALEGTSGLAGYVLDAELHNGQPRSIVHADCKRHAEVMSAGHENPLIIYTRGNWWNANVGYETWSRQHILWVAHYYWPYVKEPAIPSSWSRAGQTWGLWQWTDKGRRPGFDKVIDLDWIRPEVLEIYSGEEPPLKPKAEVIVSYNAQEVDVVLDGS